MHELSYATALLESLEESAVSRGIRRVTKVRVLIGEDNFILADSLEFAFSALTAQRGELLEGARLELAHGPGREFRLTSY
jgi:Zn finger protein HypA/HybF involved in hydrogenase expression